MASWYHFINMLPVIIGSYALNILLETNIETIKDKKDIDIICEKKTQKKLKDDIGSFPDNTILDFIFIESSFETDKRIYRWCNKNIRQCETITIGNNKFIIPNIMILYAIYASHIHRILPIANNQEDNIRIWISQIKKYTMLRKKIGYEIDDIMYKNKACTHIEKEAHDIFHDRFLETTKKHGDTFSLFGNGKEAFFDDSVDRIIDHDELHKKVAVMERGTDELIFKRFQIDSVEIQEKLFMEADKNDRCNMFREEIIVLVIERALIPELMNIHKNGGNFYEFDKKYLTNKIKEVVVHLITNLSGNGHYFLRRYALNHYDLLDAPYNLDGICKIAMELTGTDISDKIEVNKINIIDAINYMMNNPVNMIEIMGYDTPHDKFDLEIKFSSKFINNIINYVKLYDDHLIVVNNSIYNYDKNIGVVVGETGITVFSFENVKLGEVSISLDIRYDHVDEFTDIVKYNSAYDSNIDCIEYEDNTTVTYYQSYYCTEGHCPMEQTKHDLYLNTFGKVPSELKVIIEAIVRSALDDGNRYDEDSHYIV